MKYKYEAVSGDQSLFDLVDAFDFHTMIVKYKGCIYSTDSNASKNEVIAERKVKEVKLPVIGDKCKSLHDKWHECTVVYSNGKYVTVEFGDGSCLSRTIEEFYYDYTIIEQSKQPNPVNMVEGKWVPSIGDKFKTDRLNGIYLCLGSCDRFVTAVNTESGIRQPFSISYNKFIKA